MAHEITASDGLVLHRERAWHGLGVVVEQAPTAREALKLARLDWSVEQWAMSATDGERRVAVGSHVLNVRSDNGEGLGVVGVGYKPVQNAELADFADALGADGSVKIESAGSIRGGRRLWFLAKGDSVWASDRDEVKMYLLLANGHDGTMAVTAQPTSVRVVCRNTLHAAMSDRARAVKFRHEGDITDKLDAARRALGVFAKVRDGFADQVKALNARSMSRDELQRFWIEVYSETVEPIPANPATKAEREAAADARAVLLKWGSNFDRDRQRCESPASAWTALNAVTEWFDHQKMVKGKDDRAREQNRLYAKWWGEAAESKGTALKAALALV